MVEALVINKETDGAWQLVREVWVDRQPTAPSDTVWLSTLLKGFSAQPGKIMAMYDEMQSRKMKCDTITYNTILDPFAQCRTICRVPRILEDMKASTPPVEPDMVTSSDMGILLTSRSGRNILISI